MLKAFVSPEYGLIRDYACKKCIEEVFTACVPRNPEILTKLLSYLPPVRATRKNIQYLQPDEVARLKQALTEKKSTLSLRDRAIGIMALYTGLRCSDIAGLTLGAVDLKNDLLRIRQQKTGVPLELPLTAIVGNAVLITFSLSVRTPSASTFL